METHLNKPDELVIAETTPEIEAELARLAFLAYRKPQSAQEQRERELAAQINMGQGE